MINFNDLALVQHLHHDHNTLVASTFLSRDWSRLKALSHDRTAYRALTVRTTKVALNSKLHDVILRLHVDRTTPLLD